MQNPVQFAPQLTADGSYTFFSDTFGEAFHSREGAKQEAQEKFVIPCQLPQKARVKPTLKLLDVCYGLGYNTAAALETIWTINPNCYIEWYGLELDATVPQQAIAHRLLDAWTSPIPELLAALATTYQVQTPQLSAQLLIKDARETIQYLNRIGLQADAIFLDPFSPPKCPQLWTVEFLARVTQCLAPTGRLATYSCSASMRTALQLAGLKFGAINLADRSPGTIASFSAADLPPLSLQEQEHLQTRAAIPYRDPQLTDDAETIKQRRQQEQQSSHLEPTTRWRKRWQGQKLKTSDS